MSMPATKIEKALIADDDINVWHGIARSLAVFAASMIAIAPVMGQDNKPHPGMNSYAAKSAGYNGNSYVQGGHGSPMGTSYAQSSHGSPMGTSYAQSSHASPMGTSYAQSSFRGTSYATTSALSNPQRSRTGGASGVSLLRIMHGQPAATQHPQSASMLKQVHAGSKPTPVAKPIGSGPPSSVLLQLRRPRARY